METKEGRWHLGRYVRDERRLLLLSNSVSIQHSLQRSTMTSGCPVAQLGSEGAAAPLLLRASVR